MKKNILLLSMVALSSTMLAQIGINTPNPRATFDITAKNAIGNSTNVDGLLIPRIDRQRAQSMTAIPTSTLVYLNNITTGTQTGIAINIDSIGYYYFDGSVWKKMNVSGDNIYNSNGILSANRIVTQGARTLSFTATAVNAFSVDGSTFSVDAANHRVGIGTVAPNSNFQVVGDELRVGGPASQAGTVANPIVRIHSNANADSSGGALWFNENSTDYGYYIKHNTNAGAMNGVDGLAIGSAQPTRYDYNPARPGIFISDRQHIGLGTATPQAMFHIDGARDNNINTSPTTAQQANDFVVNASGNIGIGTTGPTNKVDIRSATNGALKIVDGTEGANKVLTSDANGVAT
ncbi:hypothetical protein [Chryseobacterium sp. M5A1_1a]